MPIRVDKVLRDLRDLCEQVDECVKDAKGAHWENWLEEHENVRGLKALIFDLLVISARMEKLHRDITRAHDEDLSKEKDVSPTGGEGRQIGEPMGSAKT